MASTVLVVDDEATVRDTVALRLEQDGHRVITAADGAEALRLYHADKPDLILLDLMLPELSGIEITRIVRGESDVPILMLTARDSELDKVVGLELGADDYVTKPFSMRELQARVRALLRRHEAAQAAGTADGQALIQVGTVSVDLAGHRVIRDGTSIPMKPKAFDLLAFFVRNPGHVFTRQQLLERVWGSDYPGETRTVDVHVHWLRSEIEEDPGHPQLLETVRGVGYVLRTDASPA
jgi:DNA-binding response OmpR family regulator